MPNERKARVVKIGDGYCVFLPIDWIRGNRVRKGTVLELQYDGVVIVKPPEWAPAMDAEP